MYKKNNTSQIETIPKKDSVDKDKVDISAVIADKLIGHFKFAVESGYKISDMEKTMKYKNGVFTTIGTKSFLFKIIREELGQKYTTRTASSVISNINSRSFKEMGDFDKDINVLNLQNCMYDLCAEKQRPHDPKYNSTIQIPVNYNPAAKCPAIDKFIREIVSEKDIPVIYEMIGYCLYREYRLAKAFMLLGTGRNGKSTLLNLLRVFLGKNISSLTLQDISDNNFAASGLHMSMANICDDIPKTTIKDSSMLKRLTGNAELTADRKNAQPVSFINYGKLIFGCNELPQTYDKTPAFYARIKLIEFNHQFTGSDADTNLLEKLTTAEELSGLLNKAIDGLQRVLKNKEFSNPMTIEEVGLKFAYESDSVREWTDENIYLNKDNEILSDDLYNNYLDFCGENDITLKQSQRALTKMMRALYKKDKYFVYGQKMVNGKRTHTFQGIGLISDNIGNLGEKIDEVESFELDVWT